MINEFKELDKTEQKFIEIEKKMCDLNIISDREMYKNLNKELKNITPIVNLYINYKKERKNIDDLNILLKENPGKEMEDLIECELKSVRENLENIKKEIKFLLLPRDPNDDRNVIIEIRGGAGGAEAALFSSALLRMYMMYAQSKKWKTEIVSFNETGLGGYKEVCVLISGDCAYSQLKHESGVHRVQRVPETETQGRVHTSTVTVAVLPEAEDVEIEIDPTDLQIDTFRASGAGGQHVNKTESAIRITHIPSGVIVECQDERSQYKNKDRAMKILKSKLLQAKIDKQTDENSTQRRLQIGTGDRSERIRTYNYAQNRVTDHRIGLSLYKLEDILNGNIQEIIDALGMALQSKILAENNLGI
ncbi:MAG: peptide chain release factor 1 [Candidatus Improbicoccus devescovinae]|nr:MAG: peptide chain release factor 1 [Candidatus Improbicoccus devescovinae]